MTRKRNSSPPPRIHRPDSAAPSESRKPVCPDHLQGIAREEWNQLVAILREQRTLSAADGPPLELYCRMYADFESFSRGWRRIYSEAANRKPWRLRRAARRLRTTSTVLPVTAMATLLASLVALLVLPGDPLALIALGIAAPATVAYWLAVLAIYRMGNTPVRLVPWYPYGAWATGGILAHAGGPAAGVASIRQAWEAALDGRSLEQAASVHPELRQAIETYGAV